MLDVSKVLFSIVNYKTRDLTIDKLSVINQFSYKNKLLTNIIIFNNYISDIFDKEVLEHKFENLKISIQNSKKNIGYAAAQKYIFLKSRSFKFLLFINPDILISHNDIKEFLIKAKFFPKNFGQITANIQHGINGKIYTGIAYVDKSYNIILEPYGKNEFIENKFITKFACGAFVLFNIKSLQKTGGFDEDYFLYWDDVDISHRLMKNGFGLYSVKLNKPLLHLVGESSKSFFDNLFKYYYFLKGKKRFKKKLILR